MSDAISPTKKYHRTAYPSIDPTRPELSAKNKTVVVTGGGTGIGAETALYFAKAGASRVFLLGRREQALLDNKARIEGQYPETKVLTIPTDTTKADEVDAAFTKIASYGKAHVLVSAAGLLVLGNVLDLPAEEWFAGVQTNVLGTYNIARAFLANCAPSSVLIDLNSSCSHTTIAAGFSAYNVSKAATSRLYSSLTVEHPEHSFFSIQPGVVDTAMNRQSGFKPRVEGEDYQWKEEGASWLSTYDDASLPASFMVWLASPEARFLSGKYLWANWDVDELKEMREELQNSLQLSIGLLGWPFPETAKR